MQVQFRDDPRTCWRWLLYRTSCLCAWPPGKPIGGVTAEPQFVNRKAVTECLIHPSMLQQREQEHRGTVQKCPSVEVGDMQVQWRSREAGLTLTHRQGLPSSTEQARNAVAILRKIHFSADTHGFPPKCVIRTTGPVPRFPTWLRPGPPRSDTKLLLVMANGIWTHRLHPHGCGFNLQQPRLPGPHSSCLLLCTHRVSCLCA